MPTFQLYDFGAADRVALRLQAAGRVGAETTNVMAKIALDMMRVEEAVFTSQGRRGGGSWARLKEDTIARKGNSRILFTEGANPGYPSGRNLLFDSLTKPEAPYQYLKVFKSSVQFGTRRPFAYVHQYGSSYKNRPKREYLRFTQHDINRWKRWMQEHFAEPFIG